MMTSSVHDTAIAAHAHGLCVIPIKTDGSKAPNLTRWKHYQDTISTLDEIDRWFADEDAATGLGLVTGAVSGDLELFEFDDADVIGRLLAQVDDAGLADLVQRVITGYREQTPSGGEHWLYRLDGGGAKTTLLAGRPAINAKGQPYIKPLIETKGEGGFVVIAPSHGSVHPSGLPYRLLAGGFSTIATLTHAERDALWSLARTFDEQEPRAHRVPSTAPQEASRWVVKPGDAFVAAVDWPAILDPHDWEAVRQQGEATLWRRPGGYPGGWGASTNYAGSDLLYVWTSAAPPFEPGRAYGKFAAYTLLNHDGDFTAAAKDLAAQGYGEPSPAPGPGPHAPGAKLAAAAEHIAVPPFPVDALPPVMRAFVVEGAAALGCPPDFVAMPLFAFLGGVAGNSRKLEIKPGWDELPVIWSGVIGRPGAVKTPALNLARKLVDRLQKTAWEMYLEQLDEWTETPKDERGPKPVPEIYFATDTTTQAVGPALMHSRGLTVVHDELAGWVKAFDAYSAAGDRQFWLSAWSSQPLKPNRKTGEHIYVAEPVANVTGGIQPEVVTDLAGDAQRNDGFLPRFWLVWPDAPIALWTDAVMPEATRTAMEQVVTQLRLPGDAVVLTRLSRPAYDAWTTWFDENQRAIADLEGIAAGWAAKAASHLGRLVLILHMVTNPGQHPASVDVQTLQNGIAILEYLRAHLRRVLPMFGAVAPGAPVGLAARIERIARTAWPDWVTRTEINDRLGGHEDSGAITRTLRELEEAGIIGNRRTPTAGRTRDEWRWCPVDEREPVSGKTEKRTKGVNGDDPPAVPPDLGAPVASEDQTETLFPASSVFPQPSLFAHDEDADSTADGWEHWEVPE
jgi:hypothetical protein